MTTSYPPPVDQLLTLGRPETGSEWRDYRELGLSAEHVPALLALMGDPALKWENRPEDADEAPSWASTHAWRALGQLGAGAAVEPLIRILITADEDDWATEDIPRALGMIGPPALPLLRSALPRAARRDEDPWPAIHLASSLQEIGVRHPEAREQVMETLVRQLRLWEHQEPELNAFLICYLVDLRAAEAAPLMQEAYEGGAVDEFVMGDWEDVQVALGLLSERNTPRPHRNQFLRIPNLHRVRIHLPVPGSTSAAAKSRQRRKAQKQASKKRRRR